MRSVALTPAPSKHLRVGVGIATAGRPEILRDTIALMAAQIRAPDVVLVCSPGMEDVDGLCEANPHVVHLLGQKGLPHQRNRLLDAAGDLDLLVFLDDDFVMAAEYLAETEAVFMSHPDVVMTTGDVVADGILGPGLLVEDAKMLLAKAAIPSSSLFAPIYNGYGCNMAVRLATVFERGLRFDEHLPLYAWLEDVDFSRSLAPFGSIVRVASARGVHLGIKSGRQPGIRLGYSQIANPCYLIAKGTCSWKKGLFHMTRNVAANLLGTLRGEKAVDRRGRLFGNMRAMLDLVTQRLAPSRALCL
jgi:hypothetical protein